MAEGSRLESRVPYTGEQEVAPSSAIPDDYLSLRANPSTFGAQIGGALQDIGKAGEQLGAVGMDYLVKRQGLINEAAYTQADSDYQVSSGKVMDEFRNLSASDQIAKGDEYVDKLLQARNSLRASLPNDASRRGFDTLTMRSQGYMIRDLGTISAQSHKTLFKQAANASVNVSVDGASRPEIAFDDARFNDQIANIKFQIPGIVAIDDVDIHKVGATVDAKTGNVTFPSTPEGQQAQAIYQNSLNTNIGKAWKNRIETIAGDPDRGSPVLAQKILEQHKSEIPSATYAELSHALYPSVRNEQTRNFSDKYMGNVNGDYQKSAGDPDASAYPAFDEKQATLTIDRLFPNSQITSTGRDVAHNAKVGGKPNSEHLEKVPGDPNSGQATDFTPPVDENGNRLNLNEIRHRFQQEGIPVTELIAEKGTKPVSDINEADHIHWGFKQKGGTALTQADQKPIYTSQEQYFLQHRSDIIEDGVNQAAKEHPNWGASELDTVKQRLTQNIDQRISQQQGEDRADKQTLVEYAVKNNLKTLDNLSKAPAEVQHAYERTLANDSYFIYNFQNKLISTNAKGQSPYYGTNYYNILTKVMTGQITDMSQLPDIGYGKDAVLTNTGLKSILQTMQSASDPAGKAFNISELDFLKKARGLVSATGIAPGLKTQELDEDFNKWLQYSLPKIESARSQGKSPDEIFDEKSPDFVGWPKATDPSKVMKEVMIHRLNQLSQQKSAPKKPIQLNSLQSLMEARKANQIDDNKFRQIAKQHPDWFTKSSQNAGPNVFNE